MGRGRPRYYVVEDILDSKVGPDGTKLYLIKWKDWSHRDNTWEPIKHLAKVEGMVKKFEKKQRGGIEKKKQKIRNRHETKIMDIILKGTRRSIEEIRKIRIRNAKYIRAETKPRLKKSKNIRVKLEENKHEEQGKRTLLSRDKRLILQSKGSCLSSTYLKKQERQRKSKTANSESNVLHKYSERKLRKRRIIKKAKKMRLTRSLTAMKIKNRLLESKKQMRQSQTSEGYLKKEEDEVDDLDIEQILMNCMSYQNVVVQLKNETLHYRIPYHKDNKTLYFQTTSSEILKVNPAWLTGYLQGFYL